MFVDFRRAFDSLGHGVLWNILEHKGVKEKLTRIIKLYANTTCRVLPYIVAHLAKRFT